MSSFTIYKIDKKIFFCCILNLKVIFCNIAIIMLYFISNARNFFLNIQLNYETLIKMFSNTIWSFYKFWYLKNTSLISFFFFPNTNLLIKSFQVILFLQVRYLSIHLSLAVNRFLQVGQFCDANTEKDFKTRSLLKKKSNSLQFYKLWNA